MAYLNSLEIGPTPAEEPCEQLGPDYSPTYAIKECQAFVRLIRRSLGPEPEGAELRITHNPHDFGTYHSVAVRYEEGNDAAIEYAFNVEANAPIKWDLIARMELGLV
jgi:hypothetical protein